MYRLKLKGEKPESVDALSTIPTVGFNVETVQHKNIKFNVWVCYRYMCIFVCKDYVEFYLKPNVIIFGVAYFI